jgi:signal transduction histidine kinase/ActR/RegA family two-component response regulator
MGSKHMLNQTSSRLAQWIAKTETWPWMNGMNAETTLERRRWFLKTSMLVQVLLSVIFFFLEQTEYDHRIHLAGCLGYILLWLFLQQGGSYRGAAHWGFAVALAHIVAMSATAGGINATAMVWITVVTLPSIMLLSRRDALMWAIIAVAVNLFMYEMTRRGVFDSYKIMDKDLVVWTLFNKAAVVCVALGVVYMADYMHRQQTMGLDHSNQALEKTHQALMQAQAHKEEFIASVGHELRTPMNAILGLNGILRTELSGSKEDVAVVDLIRRSTEQLLQVVNDILDFSQLQAGQLALQVESFELIETVREVVAIYANKAAEKSLPMRLDIEGPDPLWVDADKSRLTQILKNLLDNAVKFTAHGHVEVRLKSVGSAVRFEIEDTGIGIPADRQQQVFDRFEFADMQTNRQYGGTGLGLSICERLVSLQGGQIGVHSVQGQGTTFWFELPLSLSPQANPVFDQKRMSDLLSRQMKVLLVDDNAVNLMVARLMLKKIFKNADITDAQGGAQALELIKTHVFDLVLMDMVMPDVDGLQATQTLRQTYPEPLCDLPVLGLTASTNPADRARCLDAGMNDVMSKPLDERQMVVQISKILNQHRKDLA